MRMITARDAAKSFGALLDDAAKQPVAVCRHGRPCAVVMDHGLFRKYQAAYEAAVEQRYAALLDRTVQQLAEGRLKEGQLTFAEARRVGDEISSGNDA